MVLPSLPSSAKRASRKRTMAAEVAFKDISGTNILSRQYTSAAAKDASLPVRIETLARASRGMTVEMDGPLTSIPCML